MSTTSDAPAATAKLIWNSPIDSEETFEAVTAGLKTSLIKGRVWHCVSESESTASLTTRPSRLQAGRKGYDTRLAAWEKSLRELNGDANEAMGTLMSLFNPECNAHRSLSDWFAEDVTSMLAPDYKNRRDYNFRHAWTKFYAEYQPNKEVNLDTILKKWEALTDEDHSFAEFSGTTSRTPICLTSWSSSVFPNQEESLWMFSSKTATTLLALTRLKTLDTSARWKKSLVELSHS
jgi:hypothetical protein